MLQEDILMIKYIKVKIILSLMFYLELDNIVMNCNRDLL